MKAIITRANKVEIDGRQSVSFEIQDNDGNVLATSEANSDVDGIEAEVIRIAGEFKQKYLSEKQLKLGDVIEV